MSEIAAQILAQGTQAPEAPAEQVQSEAPAQPQGAVFDAVAKMERKLRAERESFKSKEQRLAELEAKLAEFDGFEQNPLAVLQKKGWDLEKINKHALETLGDDDLDPVARRFKEIESNQQKMRDEILKEAEAKIAAKEKEIQERENQYQIKMFKGQLKAHLQSKAEEYELINAEEDGAELVYDVIWHDLESRSKDHDGQSPLEPMDFDTAAQKVEAYLDAQMQKYLSLKKVRSKVVGDQPDWTKAIPQEKPRTLTASMTAKSSIDPSQLSEEQRIALAVEGMKSGKWAVSV